MSTDLSIFRDKNVAVTAPHREIDEVTRRLTGSGMRKRISIRGGKFRMIVNGKEAARSQDNMLDLIVVNAAPTLSRSYYVKTFDPNATTVPDCWSNDNVRPDPKAPARQAAACQTCPKNIDGSGTGGKGRACRFHRRLAVMLANDPSNSDIYQLSLPATSIFGKAPDESRMGLDAYVAFLTARNFPITGVVTEFRLDQDSATPKLYMRAARPLTVDEDAIVQEKIGCAEAIAAVSFDPAILDGAPKPESSDDVPAPVVRGAKPTPTGRSAAEAISEWADDPEVDD